MDYERALEFARDKHEGQKRKGGQDYIEHPKRVVELLRSKNLVDMEVLIGALFHDLLEDTDAREEEIIFYGSERVLELVKLLSKNQGYNMADYIERIKKDLDARNIKLADRVSNLEDSLGLKKDYEDFLKKYYLETEKYFIDLSQDTVFEGDLNRLLNRLKEVIETI